MKAHHLVNEAIVLRIVELDEMTFGFQPENCVVLDC